jgi:cytochrome c5
VNGRLTSLVVLDFLVLCGLPLAAQPLPEGAGADLVRTRCLACHEADLIVQQRLSQAGWERELDKMIRWGAVIDASERAPLVAYLARHFAPKPAASHAPAGEATYKRACLTCHDGDLVDQQRLTRTGWTREVEKMIRWGATVSESEREALVDYLLSRTGR